MIERRDVQRTPHAQRRSEYKATRRQERWMVPLLADAIASRIEGYRPSSPGPHTCLDVGCGGQPWRAKLIQSGFEYASFDVHQNAAGTIDYLGRIDGELPASLAARQFDFIVCTEVLEHVPDWPRAFGNLSSLLKAGGRLLITCPHLWVPHEEPYDYFRPTNWAVRYHAERAGLDVVDLARLGDGYDVLGTVLAAVRLRAPRRRPLLWLFAGPAALLRKLALKVLQQRWLKRVIELRTGLYLSTVAVLERR